MHGTYFKNIKKTDPNFWTVEYILIFVKVIFFILKGTYYAPLFYEMRYKSLVSPECVCEVSAQNTHRSFIIACQICPYLGVSIFVCVPLNTNELLLPAPFPEEGGALTAHTSVA